MAERVAFTAGAWESYLYWQAQDRKTLERINLLIRECRRDAFQGIGKPEPLKGRLSGCWSRHIDEKHRLVYRVAAGDVEVLSCRYHYAYR